MYLWDQKRSEGIMTIMHVFSGKELNFDLEF